MDASTALVFLAASAASSAASVYNNQQSIKYASEANDSQIGLANTAHQREVRDLEAAGLNPILSSSTNGAATPQLRVPGLESIDGGIGSSAGSIARAMNGMIDAELETAKADASTAKAYAKQADQLASAERESAELDLELARLDADARLDAIQGTSSIQNYGKEGVYPDLVQMYRNEIKSGRYRSSLGHAVYDDIRAGVSSAADLVGAAKGVKDMLPEKRYRDLKSTSHRRRLPQ